MKWLHNNVDIKLSTQYGDFASSVDGANYQERGANRKYRFGTSKHDNVGVNVTKSDASKNHVGASKIGKIGASKKM